MKLNHTYAPIAGCMYVHVCRIVRSEVKRSGNIPTNKCYSTALLCGRGLRDLLDAKYNYFSDRTEGLALRFPASLFMCGNCFVLKPQKANLN